jgi:hypothetical protein
MDKSFVWPTIVYVVQIYERCHDAFPLIYSNVVSLVSAVICRKLPSSQVAKSVHLHFPLSL